MWWSASLPTLAAKPRRSPPCRAILTWSARRTRARILTSTPMASASSARKIGSTPTAPRWAPDNGVGVAAALAVMESKTIQHGPMEFVFTVEEETTLGGASAFKAGVLKARYLLNLDNEEKGTLCIGCAGGLNTRARRKVAFQVGGAGAGYRVKVSGLRGGHSGVDIHLGRGNAMRILGGTLQLVMEKIPVEAGGSEGRQRAQCDSARGFGDCW